MMAFSDSLHQQVEVDSDLLIIESFISLHEMSEIAILIVFLYNE